MTPRGAAPADRGEVRAALAAARRTGFEKIEAAAEKGLRDGFFDQLHLTEMEQLSIERTLFWRDIIGWGAGWGSVVVGICLMLWVPPFTHLRDVSAALFAAILVAPGLGWWLVSLFGDTWFRRALRKGRQRPRSVLLPHPYDIVRPLVPWLFWSATALSTGFLGWYFAPRN